MPAEHVHVVELLDQEVHLIVLVVFFLHDMASMASGHDGVAKCEFVDVLAVREKAHLLMLSLFVMSKGNQRGVLFVAPVKRNELEKLAK